MLDPHDVRKALAHIHQFAPFFERQQEGRVVVACTDVGHVGSAKPARHFVGHDRVVDGTRINGLHLGVKQVAAFLEEGPAFLKKEGKRTVCIDLCRIRFDLAEVRINRQVSGEVRGDAVLQVKGRLSFDTVVVEAGVGVVEVIQPAGLDACESRQDFQVAGRLDICDAFQRPELAGPARIVTAHGRPGVRIAAVSGMGDPDRSLPRLYIGIGKTDAPERDLHFYLVAVFSNFAFRFVNEVKTKVLVIARNARVALYPQWIGGDKVDLLPVSIGIERQPHVVVLPDLVPVAVVRPDGARIVFYAESDVQVRVIVGKEGGDIDGRPDLFFGKGFRKIGGPGCIAPAGVVQVAIYRDGSLQRLDMNRGLKHGPA